MITNSKKDAWELWDVYAKNNKGVFGYSGANTLFSWGSNTQGQLGQNNRISYSSPVQIPGTNWSSIAASINLRLATKTDGTLWAWGHNSYGQLGQNNLTYYSSPVQIPGTTWSSVSAGSATSLAIKTDGTLWAWGYNGFGGSLGQNNTIPYSSPVQIPGTNWNFVTIETDGYSVFATKTDGTLWSWGYNNVGQLGIGTRYPDNKSSPVQIPGTNWSKVSACSGVQANAMATKTDGTLWTWGGNAFGQLGQNNNTYASSPVQIPGTTWSSIANEGGSFLATKTDGTLWGCGYNFQGQLGQNNTIYYYSSPVQIPGTNWNSVFGASGISLALKSDNTLWAWGGNTSGQLGQNNTTRYSSPVQIPGTNWSKISTTSNNTSATQTQ